MHSPPPAGKGQDESIFDLRDNLPPVAIGIAIAIEFVRSGDTAWGLAARMSPHRKREIGYTQSRFKEDSACPRGVGFPIPS